MMAAMVDKMVLLYIWNANSPHLPNATTFLVARET